MTAGIIRRHHGRSAIVQPDWSTTEFAGIAAFDDAGAPCVRSAWRCSRRHGEASNLFKVKKMSLNPIENQPHGTFAEFANTAPVSAIEVDTFKMALYHDGVQLGWLGQNSGEWAVLVDSAAKALTLEQYPYNGVTYYRILGTSRYMSVSNNAYVGFYNWIGARGWTRQGSILISDFNHQKLSLYSKDNAYLYAWDAYTVLDARFDEQ
ncbi:hypothetical protein [Burkholderia orbicola]|uniref:hypothetical protein n=1 Tax=Burkholderia orbicola TaxID=2978683 RepID=UPI002FE25995